MAKSMFSIPGVGEREREHVSADIFRGIVSDVISLDFEQFVEGVVGNLLGISRGLFLISVFSGFLVVLAYLIPNLPFFAFAWIVGTLPIWLPIVAIVVAWRTWVWYVQSYFLSNQRGVLLEVKMPRDLVKSPRGMDNALHNLALDAGETTYFNRKWSGQVRPFFSLEIASFGGEVHFYVWTWEKWRMAVEGAIYSQYPEVEIYEVEDYAAKFRYDPAKMMVFCTDHRYEPRNDAYPIKTYVEFEIDKDPKEEYKVDPLALVLETLSGLKPGEQIWLQIVITSNKEARRVPGKGWFQTESSYTGIMRKAVEEIRKENVEVKGPEDEWKRHSRVRSYRIERTIELIERNMGKYPYNVGMRGVYIANPPELFGPTFNLMRWIWKPMGSPQYLNQMRPRRWHTPFDYPYQDLWDHRWHLHAQRFFDCYRRRSHFYSPYILPHNMMSTEVIATFWHPISSGVKAPGIERIPAKKAEPPPNLPK